MRYLYGCFLLLLVGAVPMTAQAQKKGVAEAAAATPQDYTALANYREVVGRLITVDPFTKTATFRYEYEIPDPDAKPGKTAKKPDSQADKQALRDLQEQQRLQKEYLDIQRITNPMQRAQRLQQFMAKLQSSQQKHYFEQMQQQTKLNTPAKVPTVKMIKMSKDFVLELVPQPRVPLWELPVEYNDKGMLVQNSPEELKKRKDAKMPGYTGVMDDLQPGVMAKFYLLKRKPAAPDKKPEEPAGEKLPEIFAAGRATAPAGSPQIEMVLVTSIPDPAYAPKEPKGAKKKKN